MNDNTVDAFINWEAVLALSKADLIIHPVRFRIMRSLAADSLTTQEIASRMADVPKSSIYRHLRLLLEGELVYVSDTNLVRGIHEKRYRLAQLPYLGAGDVAGFSADQHLHYFTLYLLTILEDYANYLGHAEAAGGVDMVSDQAGYTEVTFYASPGELDVLQSELNQSVSKLLGNSPVKERARRKFAVVSHPLAVG